MSQREQVLLGETRHFGNQFELRMPPPSHRREAGAGGSGGSFNPDHSTAYALYETGGRHMNDQYIFHSVKLVGDTIWVYKLQHDSKGATVRLLCLALSRRGARNSFSSGALVTATPASRVVAPPALHLRRNAHSRIHRPL
jgi:hypothetical protein